MHRDFRDTHACKILSVIILFFFCWSFAGLRDVAWAAANPDTLKTTQKNSPQRDNNKSHAARMQGAMEDVRDALKDDKLSMKKQKARLKDLRKEVRAQDDALRAEFKQTRARLKEKGLSKKILKRHDEFVARYKRKSAKFDEHLTGLYKARTKSGFKKKAKDALAFIKKHEPPSREKKLDPNKLPHRVPEVKNLPVVGDKAQWDIETGYDYYAELEKETLDRPFLVASNGSLTGVLDGGGEYLSETLEVKFTQEIQDLAAELEHHPVKMYEWVRNFVKFEPYYGSLKGARQTYMEKAGNDYDQASLLIALLRSSGISARYASGNIRMPIEQAMNWLGGAKTPEVAGRILATNSIPSKLLVDGGEIKYVQLEHVWVEAYVDMEPSFGAIPGSGGQRWTPIDPSYAKLYVQEGLNIAKDVPFDEMEYLSSVNNTPPIAEYLTQLDTYYSSINNGFFFETLYGTVIIPEEHGMFMGTLPYKMLSAEKFAVVSGDKQHTAGLGLIVNDGNPVSITKPLAEIAGRKITLSYAPSSMADQELIDSYGGLLSTPAYLVQVKPQIKVDDVAILSGEAMTLGTKLQLRTDLDGPSANWPRAVDTKDVSYGLHFAIAITALDYPSMERHDHSKGLLSLEGRLSDSLNSMDDSAGDLLHNMVIEYFGQFALSSKALQGIHGVQDLKMPSLALLSATASYDSSFGVAVSPPQMDGFTTDAYYLMSSPTSLSGDAVARKAFLEQIGLVSSYLEHRTIENLLIESDQMESISAVKAIQLANEQGITIHTITQANVTAILPTMNISESDRQLIADSVNAGNEVIVPASEVVYKEFKGLGLLVRDPQTGAGAYLISEGFGGQKTFPSTDPAFADAGGFIAFVFTSEMLTNVKGGGYIEDSKIRNANIRELMGFTMLVDSMAIYSWSVIMAQGYTPFFILHAEKKELVRYLSDSDIWVVAFFGHGYGDSSSNNATLGLRESDNLWATDLKSIVKSNYIKFAHIATCGSGIGKDAYMDGFGIDGSYINKDGVEVDRNEAFVGTSCDYVNLGSFATETYLLWKHLFSGKSVDTAVDLTNNAMKLIGVEECLLDFSGSPSTYIWP